MDKKRILFVDDEVNVLDGLRRTLRHMRQEWDMSFAHGGEEALEVLARQPFDVIVSDMRMPGVDGVQLLSSVKQNYPDMVRIALSGHSSKEAMLRATGPIHQYLPKPCDVVKLKITVNRICGLRGMLKIHKLQRLTDQLESLPCLSNLHTKLVEELQHPETTVSMIGKIISQDIGLSAKVLQTVNSAFFGLRRQITNIEEAVAMLGLRTIKILTLSMHVYAQFPTAEDSGFSPESLHEHSIAVGMAAKNILQKESLPSQLMDYAFLAGLLHDIGKLVFAAKIPDFFYQALEISRQQQLPLCQAEQDVIGADHSQVGAYLLGLWGFCEEVINAVAFHHRPRDYYNADVNPFGGTASQGVWVLTGVHAADALIPANPSAPSLDRDFLEQHDLGGRLEAWKGLCQNMLHCGSNA